ncbi:MAG: DMT family transporter [Granulosicoccaceae bacterium]
MPQSIAPQSYRRGVIYIVFAGVFMSSGGLLVRMIEQADPWTILFYRSITFAITVLLFMLFRSGKSAFAEFRGFAWLEWIVAVSVGLSFITYLLSLFYTSVANTVIIISSGPLFAAVMGWLVLREVVGIRTWISIALAVSGLLVMFTADVSLSDILGMAYALFAVAMFAVMIVAVRRSTRPDMLAATCCAGLVAAIVSAFMMPSFALSTHDLLVAIGLGSFQIGVSYILITLGSRSVPSAQVPILCLPETALAPLWVWLSISETPDATTIVGGALVLSAVVFQGVTGIRRRQKENIVV